MAVYFFDTSAIVKRYVLETGTGWIRTITDPAIGNGISIARITQVECVSAITRRRNTGNLSPADASTALSQFRTDFSHLFEINDITNAIIQTAADYAETHLLRAYDAVQLAVVDDIQTDRLANGFSPITLISADLALNTAAVTLGIPVEDPNNHP